MTKQEIAKKYIECFCSGDIEGIDSLLASSLKFTGTFSSYNSSKHYLDSLKNDPPDRCGYNVLSVTENKDSVAVFYEYQKPNQIVQIAQLFRIKDQKIQEVLLVFDGRGFG